MKIDQILLKIKQEFAHEFFNTQNIQMIMLNIKANDIKDNK